MATPPPKLKIAVAQFQPEDVCPQANFDTAVQYIRSAASQGCHIVLLPEFHLTSWAPEHPDFIASCDDSYPYLEQYKVLARDLDIHIVPGTIIKPVGLSSSSTSSPVTELHNLALFLEASTGAVLSTYQKKNLWHSERGVLSAGRHAPHQVFDVPLPGGGAVRAGMLICWDLAFPEAFRELVAGGAELVLVPSWWVVDEPAVRGVRADSEAVFLDAAVVSRAFENTAAVALCNAFGCSQVAVPMRGCLARLAPGERGLAVAEVDFETLRFAESYYKVREDLRDEEWHYTRVETRRPG